MNEMNLAALLGGAGWFGGKRRREEPVDEPRASEAPVFPVSELTEQPEFIWGPNPLFQ